MSREDILDGLAALPKNAAWVKFHAHLAELAVSEAAKHEDPALTPEQRAEHLWAMKHLRELCEWPAREAERQKTNSRE